MTITRDDAKKVLDLAHKKRIMFPDPVDAMRFALDEVFAIAETKERVGKQSSSEMSTLAARYLNYQAPMHEMEEFAKDVRSLAASVLSQDETRGQ